MKEGQMPQNLLENGGFEADWGKERSHRCLIFPKGADSYEKDVGNIFTPPGWVTWFRHDPGRWDQPEVTDAWKQHDPNRVQSGQKGTRLFTFHRNHDAGFLQQVKVAPGSRLCLTAWAHAWSNHKIEGHGDCYENGRCSCGVGEGAAFILKGGAPALNGDPWNDAIPNFTFYVGIDLTGGMNPFAETVVWGRGAHIYNTHAQVPEVEAVAQGDTVTVFLRSKTLWAFKHNDAYWDETKLVVVGEEEVPPPEVRLSHRPLSPKVGETVTIEARSLTGLTDVGLTVTQPSGAELAREMVMGRDGDWHTWTYTTSPLEEVGTHVVAFSAAGVEAGSAFDAGPLPPPVVQPKRGLPRTQYERTYVLLPPDATADWALAVVDGAWDRHRYTIGGSADDAGIGDLNSRRVIAVNPAEWSDDLRAFFAEHYPGVQYVAVEAETPDELRRKLKRL
jgi:hypothetical protein